MPKLKLDSTVVLTAHCEAGKKKTDYYDTAITGFVLECRASGGKTLYLRYQDQTGRQRQHKIGSIADITFASAKKEAQRLRSEVTLGGNPAKLKEQRRAVPTYAELAKKHLEYIRGQRSYSTTESYIRLHLLPRWGKLHLSEIHQTDVAAWLADKKDSGLAPATVLKVKMIFQRSWNLALRWGTPGVTRNPVQGISIGPINNMRTRYLTEDEVQRLRTAVSKSLNPLLPAVIGLLLATGARISELLNSERRHFDLHRKSWYIPMSKNGRDRFVPLSDVAISIIKNLPQYPGCKWLLVNHRTSNRLTSIKHSWHTARMEAGIPDVRIHDLRHSSASFMINMGIDLYTVGKVLGHVNHASTARYAHVNQTSLLKAVEAGSAKLGSWTA